MIGKIVLINFFVEKKILTLCNLSKLMKNRIVFYVKNLRSVYINLQKNFECSKTNLKMMPTNILYGLPSRPEYYPTIRFSMVYLAGPSTTQR